jgi:hypothetical protein
VEKGAEIDLNNLKIKELRKMLEDRGVGCIGCSEKSDLIQRVRETIHLPIKPKEEELPKSKPTVDPESMDYQEIMKLFEKQEEENQKNQEFFEKLKRNNPEFAKQFGNANFASKAPKKPQKKGSQKEEEQFEKIEL